MKKNTLPIAAAALLGAALVVGLRAAPAEVVAIRHGRILSMAGPEIPDGTVLVKGNTIAAVGRDVAVPADARVIDARGGVIMPGMIDAHFSMAELVEARDTGSDEVSDPNEAALHVLDGLNPFDKALPRLVRGGITTALITPGRANVIGGQLAVVHLAGRTVEEMKLLAPAGIKLSLGEGPKSTFGEKGRLPSTRMGAALVVRKALLAASEYRLKWQAYRAKGDGAGEPPSRDLGLEALALLLDKSLPAFIECYRADDIMTALRLSDEFSLRTVLVGATEAARVAGEIAKRRVPVILGPYGAGPKRIETQDADIATAGILAKAGIAVALQDEGAMGIGAPDELPIVAALAMKGGLPRDLALKAITATAAEIIGISKQVGTLEPGKLADVVVFTGDPLHYRSTVAAVVINGQVVER